MEAERSKKGAEDYFRHLRFAASLDGLIASRALLDPLKLQRTAKGQPCFKLGSVYESLIGSPLIGAHGGVADAKAVVSILSKAPEFTPVLDKMGTGSLVGLPGVKNIMRIVRDILADKPKQEDSKKSKSANVLSRLSSFEDISEEAITEAEITTDTGSEPVFTEAETPIHEPHPKRIKC
jgi:hypothetical protein